MIALLLLFAIQVSAQELEKMETQVKENKLIFFSNDGCGKCSIAQEYFDKHQMPYEKLAIKENRSLMYEYVNKKTGGKKTGVGYPLLVYGDSIYFSIKDMKATLKEIEVMMQNDKTLAPLKE